MVRAIQNYYEIVNFFKKKIFFLFCLCCCCIQNLNKENNFVKYFTFPLAILLKNKSPQKLPSKTRFKALNKKKFSSERFKRNKFHVFGFFVLFSYFVFCLLSHFNVIKIQPINVDVAVISLF